MDINKEDIELIKKFADIKRRGYYCDGGQVTVVYNRVLNRNERPTTCGACIRQRIQALEDALRAYESQQAKIKASEALENEQVDNVTPEENKVSEEPKKKVGRPSKKS